MRKVDAETPLAASSAPPLDTDTLSLFLPHTWSDEPWTSDPTFEDQNPTDPTTQLLRRTADPTSVGVVSRDAAARLLHRLANSNGAAQPHDWPGAAEPVQGLGHVPLVYPPFTEFTVRRGPFLTEWVNGQLGRMTDGSAPTRPSRYVDPHDPTLSSSQRIS
ncbi:MAG: hypothetical protein HOQ05_06525 [Corynebacteriales bacterium]|nr:hypothetical protein [Mycobacteriales bacterium]